MKRLVRAILTLGSMLPVLVPAYSQSEVCANNQIVGFQCAGPNNCSQYITLRQPRFGGNQTCLVGYLVYCCSTQYQDYSDSGFTCSFVCDDLLKGFLNTPGGAEFTITHTLWAKDCSGLYRPFSRSWDVTRNLVDLKPRLSLSGIGG